MECPKCRQHNLPGSSYCEKCGFHLRSLQRQPSSSYGSYASVPSSPSASVRPTPAQTPMPNYPDAIPSAPNPTPPPQARPPISSGNSGNRGNSDHPEPQPPSSRPRRVTAATEPPQPPAPKPCYAHLRQLPQGSELPLIYDKSLIGRLSENDGIKPEIDLSPFGEGGVSRRHAQISRVEGQVFLEDLNSANGTFLNETRLQPGLQTPLKHQDEVRFGSLRFQYLHKQA